MTQNRRQWWLQSCKQWNLSNMQLTNQTFLAILVQWDNMFLDKSVNNLINNVFKLDSHTHCCTINHWQLMLLLWSVSNNSTLLDSLNVNIEISYLWLRLTPGCKNMNPFRVTTIGILSFLIRNAAWHTRFHFRGLRADSYLLFWAIRGLRSKFVGLGLFHSRMVGYKWYSWNSNGILVIWIFD